MILTSNIRNKRQTKRVATQFFITKRNVQATETNDQLAWQVKHMEMIITRTPENIMPNVQARKKQK